jgi:DNA-binding transcriptional LysR family regulator
MELRQLRYFVAVAETRNISRAAQKLFLTQPALSRQIKALEEEIGQCLLERQAHSIRLTPAGEVLLLEAREVLERADLMLERVRSAGTGVRLRVGYAPSLASGLLAEAVENFVQKHPNARVELLDLSTQEMLSGLNAGTLDVALTVGPERDAGGLQWIALAQASWQHPLATAKRVTPAEAARESLLVFSQRDYSEYWETVTGWLKEHQQRPSIGGQYDGVNSLLAAVEAGLGVAVVTAGVARLLPERVRLKALSAAPRPLNIAAGYRAERAQEQPLAVFIEELRLAARRIMQGDG